jgi:hypothetical protein
MSNGYLKKSPKNKRLVLHRNIGVKKVEYDEIFLEKII